MPTVCVISGAAPHDGNAVADYAWLLARELAERSEVTFLAPGEAVADGGRVRHRVLPPGWDLRAAREMVRGVASLRPDVLLIHYVPHMYGWQGLKPFFALALLTIAAKGYPIVTVAHEFRAPWSARPVSLARAVGHRILFRAIVRASRCVVATTPFCRTLLAGAFGRRGPRFRAIPISATLPVVGLDAARRAAVRSRWGARGNALLVTAFGTAVAPAATALARLIRGIAAECGDARFVIVGGESESLRQMLAAEPDLRDRVAATGPLPGEALSEIVSASDLYAACYADGASTRRTSLMLGLAHGVATMSNPGVLTDDRLRSGGIILIADPDGLDRAVLRRLCVDAREREAFGSRARRLYESRFDLRVVATEYERLLEDVTAGNRATPRE